MHAVEICSLLTACANWMGACGHGVNAWMHCKAIL